jgi:hypothetical protein
MGVFPGIMLIVRSKENRRKGAFLANLGACVVKPLLSALYPLLSFHVLFPLSDAAFPQVLSVHKSSLS